MGRTDNQSLLQHVDSAGNCGTDPLRKSQQSNLTETPLLSLLEERSVHRYMHVQMGSLNPSETQQVIPHCTWQPLLGMGQEANTTVICGISYAS